MLEEIDFVRLGGKGLARNLFLEFTDALFHEDDSLFRFEKDIAIPTFQGIQLAFKFRK